MVFIQDVCFLFISWTSAIAPHTITSDYLWVNLDFSYNKCDWIQKSCHFLCHCQIFEVSIVIGRRSPLPTANNYCNCYCKIYCDVRSHFPLLHIPQSPIADRHNKFFRGKTQAPNFDSNYPCVWRSAIRRRHALRDYRTTKSTFPQTTPDTQCPIPNPQYHIPTAQKQSNSTGTNTCGNKKTRLFAHSDGVIQVEFINTTC